MGFIFHMIRIDLASSGSRWDLVPEGLRVVAAMLERQQGCTRHRLCGSGAGLGARGLGLGVWGLRYGLRV